MEQSSNTTIWSCIAATSDYHNDLGEQLPALLCHRSALSSVHLALPRECVISPSSTEVGLPLGSCLKSGNFHILCFRCFLKLKLGRTMLATSIKNLPKRAKICNDTPSISIGSVQLPVEQSVQTLVAYSFQLPCAKALTKCFCLCPRQWV